MQRMLGLAVAALLTGGCAVGHAFGAGPTVDTDGVVGAQFQARGYFGVALDDENAIGEWIGVEGGPPLASSAVVAPMAGLDYLHLSDGLAFRASLRARFHMTWEGGEFASWIGAGAGFSMLPELDVWNDDAEEHHLLGFELAGYYLGNETVEVPEGETGPEKGLFGVSLMYEYLMFDEDPFTDSWN